MKKNKYENIKRANKQEGRTWGDDTRNSHFLVWFDWIKRKQHNTYNIIIILFVRNKLWMTEIKIIKSHSKYIKKKRKGLTLSKRRVREKEHFET